MNKYSVDRIEGKTAVLVCNGLTMQLQLDSLPDNVEEGDILILNSDGRYEFDSADTQKVKKEYLTRQDELFQGETFDIKKGLDYKTLLKDTQMTLFRSTNNEISHLIPELILFVLSVVCILLITLVDWNRYAQSIRVHDITSYIGTICAVFSASIGIVMLIISVIAISKTVVKIKKLVEIYKSNLRRMQEKLMNSGTFIKISPEIEHKYDRFFDQIRSSIKNREKTLEKK